MYSLQKFEQFKLNSEEAYKVKGSGWKDHFIGILVEEIWAWSKENLFSREAQERYGRRMFETGSPGGHK